jgi:hypothetical protein
LAEARCFFGGGTQLAMAYGEYRESRDIDFLCANRAGFRALREQVTQATLGEIVSGTLQLAREVRSDRDGIRTFIEVDGARIKFEILLEARIDLEGKLSSVFRVPTLSIECAIAEKLLANADRGLDESILFRDLVDLAFAAVHAGKPALSSGLAIAEQAYGTAVKRCLKLTIDAFRESRARAKASIDSLGLEETATLRKGVRSLYALTA